MPQEHQIRIPSDERDNKDDKEENMLFKEATAFFTDLPRSNGEYRFLKRGTVQEGDDGKSGK